TSSRRARARTRADRSDRATGTSLPILLAMGRTGYPDGAMADQPEIVDIDGLDRGDTGAIRRVAAAIAEPCAERGAFHVVAHGSPPAELARFADAMRRLFELPPERKERLRRTRTNAWGWYDAELTKNRRDWKEVFDYGADRATGGPPPSHSDGVNRWPDHE